MSVQVSGRVGADVGAHVSAGVDDTSTPPMAH